MKAISAFYAWATSRETISFILVGIAATLTYAISFFLIRDVFPVSDGQASIAAYAAGMIVSYFGQSRLTFQSRDSVTQVLRFFAVAGSGTIVSTIVMDRLVPAGRISLIQGVVVVCVAVPLISYLLYKFIVFIKPSSPEAGL